jgi:hypothetical protein
VFGDLLIGSLEVRAHEDLIFDLDDAGDVPRGTLGHFPATRARHRPSKRYARPFRSHGYVRKFFRRFLEECSSDRSRQVGTPRPSRLDIQPIDDAADSARLLGNLCRAEPLFAATDSPNE